MIHVYKKIPPGLESPADVSFEYDSGFDEHMNLKHQTLEEHEMQRSALIAIREKFRTLADSACDAAIEVRVEERALFCEGEVGAFTLTAFTRAGEIIEAALNEADEFRRTYPDSSFSLSYSQTVTITKVESYTVH